MATNLTIPQFADALGVSRTTVQRMIQNKAIKAVKKNPLAGRTSPLLIPASELARVKKLQNEQAKS
jgi:excisionase family DNA binding protein